jgi:hypothetical protein
LNGMLHEVEHPHFLLQVHHQNNLQMNVLPLPRVFEVVFCFFPQ